MRWKAATTARGDYPARVSLGLRERYDVDDDGVFETPDELDAGAVRRLEEAGCTRVDEPAEDEPDEPGDDAGEEEEADGGDGGELDDEYAGMDRSELYEEYKDRGGSQSWNETTEESLRDSLREYDDLGHFDEPDGEEEDGE